MELVLHISIRMDFSVKKLLSAHSDELLAQLRSSGLVEATPSEKWSVKISEDVGDGNLNFVYRAVLEGEAFPKDFSVVVKHAPTYIRVSETGLCDLIAIELVVH